MTAFRPFRFGVIAYDASSKEEWVAKARRIEQLGYDTLVVPDHLGKQLAPVPAILTAAEATRSLRVGSYVFANDFRHPVLLAKEAATLDVLTGGRFELGIGAGYLRSEYEQTGLTYDAANIRVSRLEATRTKVAWIRQAAGERFYQLELNMIMYEVIVTEDRHHIARQLAGRFKTTDEAVLTIPHCLIGTLDQISEDLQTRREQYGISYIAVFDEHSEKFAPVIACLAGS